MTRAILPSRILALAVLAFASPAWSGSCAVPAMVPATMVLAAAQGAEAATVRARLEVAGALLGEGRIAKAREILEPLAADAALSPADRAIAQSLLAVARSADGEITESARIAREAVGTSRSQSSSRVRAAIATNSALAITEAGDTRAARAALQSAAVDAAAAGDGLLEAVALVDLAMLESRAGGDVVAVATRARRAIEAMPEASRRAPLYASLGLALLPEVSGTVASPRDALAADLLPLSDRDASAARLPRDMAVALGLSGELRLLRGDSRAAITAL
ncbi:MAG: hypothetical protein NDI88_16520, partial [Lysobacter sp.]|nr:hypothetical protein [Lysobacter sp.]